MKNGYIHVHPGDLVQVEFDHGTKARVIQVRVEEVTERYGKFGGGHKAKPLVSGINEETGKEEFFDNSYVTKVLERSSRVRLPYNRFAGYQGGVQKVRRGVIRGSLTGLVATELGKLNRHLPLQLDDGKMREIFLKQRPGLLADREGFETIYTVRRKPFANWVRRNATKLCVTAAEMHRDATAFNKEQAAWMEADMERDMMDDDPLDQIGSCYDDDYDVFLPYPGMG